MSPAPLERPGLWSALKERTDVTQGTDTTVEGARLEDIEWQLDPATDYRVGDGQEPDALDMLWALRHDSDGRPSPVEGEPEGQPIDDIATGHLRPVTMAALGDCLAEEAEWIRDLLARVADLEDRVGRLEAPCGTFA